MLINNSKDRRIAVFHAKGNLDSVPSLMSTISVLTENGYYVDIFMIKDDRFLRPRVENPAVLIHYSSCRRNNRFPFLLRIRNIPPWIAYARRKCRGKKYTCFIGIDPRGLILATAIGRIQRVPVIYYSLELYLSKEIRLRNKIMKAIERRCNQKAQFTIIQDMERANLLSKDNGIPISKIVLVPNSPLGKANRRNSNFLRKRFGIAPHRKVILQAGAIASWTMSLELAMAARSWPKDWVLVLHARETPLKKKCVEQIRRVADGVNIIL